LVAVTVGIPLRILILFMLHLSAFLPWARYDEHNCRDQTSNEVKQGIATPMTAACSVSCE
jgi:hypothetical protein